MILMNKSMDIEEDKLTPERESQTEETTEEKMDEED